ncbi:MAG: adenine phosphoribosyltransferase [Bdellovibrionales bacterium]
MNRVVDTEQIRKFIRDVPDFPKPGVMFKDITPALASPDVFRSLIVHMSELIPKHTTKLAAIESRGFILGSALATHLGLGMVLIRKPGKLPYATLAHSYDLEYGTDTLQIHVDALDSGDHVCIVDDVLATGGTAGAAEVLCLETGATVTGFAFLMELSFLNGRKKLKATGRSLITY